MGICLNNEITANSIIVNNMYSKIQGYTSQFLNTDTEDFDAVLSKSKKSEVNDSPYKTNASETTETDIRNKELKKLIDKNNLERMMSRLEQENFAQKAVNFANNLYKNGYNSQQMNTLVSTAVNAFV